MAYVFATTRAGEILLHLRKRHQLWIQEVSQGFLKSEQQTPKHWPGYVSYIEDFLKTSLPSPQTVSTKYVSEMFSDSEQEPAKCLDCDSRIFTANSGVIVHVHYLRPSSDIKESYIVDPFKDLSPVCPNCHAMIHRKKPPYAIEEIKSKMVKQTNRT
jgi:hypothetical protein